MKLDIDGIQAFVLIAELGGFQRAAERLRLTQTALTRRIQRLEGYLGLRLLDRTTRSLALTAVGREFLPQAKRLVEELTQSVEQLKDMSHSSAGHVTVACLTSIAHQQLPAMIRIYARKYPRNRIRILDRTGTQVAEAVKQGHAEFGIAILPSREAALAEESIREDPFMVFCLRSHPLSALKRANWTDLRGTDLVIFGGASGNRLLIDYQLERKRLEVRGRFEVEQLSTAIGLVSAGAGVAILPASSLLAQGYPEMRQIPLVNPVIKRAIGLIRRRGVSLSPAAQALYDLVAQELRIVNYRQDARKGPAGPHQPARTAEKPERR
jgi:DNA-binding transcriptional LysR family regulator